MNNIVKWNKDYLDIPLQDMPPTGTIIIAFDPQKRLGKKTWAVLVAIHDDGLLPADAKGLFWDEEEADRFAKALQQE